MEGVLLTQPDGAILRANPEATRIFGFTEEELRAGGRSLIVDTNDPRLPGLLATRSQTGKVESGLRMRRKNGELFEGRFWSVIFEEEGERFTWMGIQDISAAVAAEKALRLSENRYRTLVDNLSEAVVLQDENGAIIASNPAAERILGLGHDAMAGSTAYDERWVAVHPDGTPWEPDTRPTVRSLREGITMSNVVIGRKDEAGDVQWSSVNSAPLFDAEHHVTGVVCSFADITERVRMEQTLVEAGRLEGISVLALGVAHQFNNLLTSILGNSSLIGRTNDAKERAASIAEIENAVVRGAELSRDLLAAAGQANVHPLPCELNELVMESHQLALASLPQGTDIALELNKGIPDVKADPAQLRRALLSVMTHELLAGSGGDWRIRTGLQEVPPAGNFGGYIHGQDLTAGTYAYVEVSDRQDGDWDAETSDALDPFGTQTRSVRSLELAVAAGIISSHGGAVRFGTHGDTVGMRLLLPLAA